MTIDELNILLLKVNSEKKRENIFEFAFGLIEWMGIEPVKEKKPRLLSPQTMKLHHALVHAPQTVQPQLYRLSSETHNVRVRLAVMKKIKKENINLLVINDPGLASYQAITGGFESLDKLGAFNPSQPYYVHFVTTSDYDKLLIIFNKGDQKRILTFRDKLTHTQYYRLLEQWKDIGKNTKPEITNLFWSSLDIKEVNKEFYKKVKDRFDVLIGIISTQKPGLDEQVVKQFTVRLIGRYIFCWFLKEKEIIPEQLLSSAAICDFKDSFSGVILNKLFFQTLNAEVTDSRRDEIKTTLDEYFKNIPYLNGGLFERQQGDELLKEIEMKEWLTEFVEVLEQYDFTVDESSSSYQQIAIDPEMLGRIFENLLASQNEETEKLANQRKAFGAFYTPREIVDYMVNESLKAHLETHLMPDKPDDITEVRDKAEPAGSMFENFNSPDVSEKDKAEEIERKKQVEKFREKLNKLFTTDNSENPFDREDTKKIRSALTYVKVLDPACGSGAFPMGMMLRLMEIRQIVGHPHKNNYELKNEILSKNIYGVDIMPMAVEIARLRAWLSLILEADYKPADRKNNFGISALPNLDFKFVCANSLIDSGYDEFTSKLDDGYYKNELAKKLNGYINRLQEIRNEYFDPKGDKDKKKLLQEEFLSIKTNIKNNFTSIRKTWNLENFLDRIDDWDPFNDNKPSSFFSPGWMFGISDGFDIVIGNPPYVRADNPSIARQRKTILESKNYKTLWEKWDLMIPFVERSVMLLSRGGVNIFILSNSITTSKYAERLQDWLVKNYFVKSIDYFKDIEVFEAGVIPIILAIQNVNKNGKETLKNYRIKSFNNSTCKLINNDESIDLKHNLFREKYSNAFNIDINSEALGDICYISYGLRPNSDEFKAKGEFTKKDLISNTRSDIYCKEYVEGKDIKAYEINSIKFLEFNTERVPSKLVRQTFTDLYSGEKLLRGRVTKGTYDDSGILCNDSIMVIKRFIDLKNINERSISVSISKNNFEKKGSKSSSMVIKRRKELEDISKNFELKYLLALINSNYAMAYLNNFRRHRLVNYFYPDDLRSLPIPIISKEEQLSFVEKVNKILSLKKSYEDTTALEKEIDFMVYKLYDLSYEEVKIVDPGFELTEKEYEEGGK